MGWEFGVKGTVTVAGEVKDKGDFEVGVKGEVRDIIGGIHYTSEDSGLKGLDAVCV